MSNAIRTENRQGLTVHICNDCRAWSHEGQAIRHSKRCDTPTAQPEIRREALTTPSARRDAARAAELSAAELKRRAREGSGLTPDQAFDAFRRGQITESEAMNRDD